MRILLGFLVLSVLSSGVWAGANELDDESTVINKDRIRFEGELPKAVVVRENMNDGTYEVLHSEEMLDADSSTESYIIERETEFQRAQTLSEEQENELDLDSSSGSYFYMGWYGGWGGYNYYPTYCQYGNYYRYRPYYSFRRRHYRYRYYHHPRYPYRRGYYR